MQKNNAYSIIILPSFPKAIFETSPFPFAEHRIRTTKNFTVPGSLSPTAWHIFSGKQIPDSGWKPACKNRLSLHRALFHDFPGSAATRSASWSFFLLLHALQQAAMLPLLLPAPHGQRYDVIHGQLFRRHRGAAILTVSPADLLLPPAALAQLSGLGLLLPNYGIINAA